MLLGFCCQSGLPSKVQLLGLSSFRSGPCSDSSKWIHALRYYNMLKSRQVSVFNGPGTNHISFCLQAFYSYYSYQKLLELENWGKQKLIEYSFEKIRCISFIFKIVRNSHLLFSLEPHIHVFDTMLKLLY